MEKKLNNLGKATNVFALFNCNRMIAYGEKLRKPRQNLYIDESRVNFLYASKVGDDYREHNLAKAYYTQAEEKLLFPSILAGAAESIVSIKEENFYILNDRLRQALAEFYGMGDAANSETNKAENNELNWTEKLPPMTTRADPDNDYFSWVMPKSFFQQATYHYLNNCGLLTGA